MSYSRDELLAAGYGMRSDPLASPDAYALWLQAASRPGRVVTRIGHPMPVRAYGTDLNSTWSGGMFEESLSGAYFEAAYSSFTVPSATPTTSCSAAAFWAGLAGGSILQTGVQLIGRGAVVYTYPFIEYYSGDYVGGDCYENECLLGFNVSAGDSMLAEVWSGDGSCRTFNFSGGYGCFYLLDITSGWSYLGTLPQILQFQGTTAEFIAEDNGPNNWCGPDGTYTEYSDVQYAHFGAVDTNNHTHTWQLDPNGYVRILSVNSSNQMLGYANLLNPDKIFLSWMHQ